MFVNIKTEEEKILKRQYPEYNDFIRKVMTRDLGVCQICGKTRSNNVVHHIDSYDWCAEKRLELSNGICLCEQCHKDFHSAYGYGKNTKEQFEEYVGYKIELGNDVILPNCKYPVCLEDRFIIKDPTHYIKRNKLCSSDFYNCCEGKKIFSIGGKHYVFYNKYVNMTDEDIEDYIFMCDIKSNKNHAVLCTTTMKVFACGAYASYYYGSRTDTIGHCCNREFHYITTKNKQNPSQRLEWIWLEDYMKKHGYTTLKEVRQNCTLVTKKECLEMRDKF